MTTAEEQPQTLTIVSDATSKLVNDLLAQYDGGLVATCLLAEGGVILAALRKAKVCSIPYIAEVFAETLSVALTHDAKSKVMFTDGKDTGSRQ